MREVHLPSPQCASRLLNHSISALTCSVRIPRTIEATMYTRGSSLPSSQVHLLTASTQKHVAYPPNRHPRHVWRSLDEICRGQIVFMRGITRRCHRRCISTIHGTFLASGLSATPSNASSPRRFVFLVWYPARQYRTHPAV